jgi:hypothetical protein
MQVTHRKPEPLASSAGTSHDLDLLFGDPDAQPTASEDTRPVDSGCVITWDWETDYGF